jgi:hypothetical protein
VGLPLSLDDGDTERVLRAGERAPDSRLSRSGTEVRLFDLFVGASFVVLASEADAAPALAAATERWPGWVVGHIVEAQSEAPPGALYDIHGDFNRYYGLKPGEMAIIRPDGYVGAIIAGPEDVALQRYLGEIIGLR